MPLTDYGQVQLSADIFLSRPKGIALKGTNEAEVIKQNFTWEVFHAKSRSFYPVGAYSIMHDGS